MAFSNRIRLPMQLHSAQFPEERQVFRKANGQAKTMSVVVRKTYELETDFLPEHWHQRLKIALAHDSIWWEGERYLGNIAQDGDYNIEWPDSVLHYPTAKGGVKVQVTPFDASNANCQTCEQLNQLNLSDDEAQGIYGALQEDQDYTVDTADNDSICCYPAVFSLTSYNSEYLTSASIDSSTGVFSFHTGTGLISGNGIVIATYRVTCPDGSYDEADITADFDGTIEGCRAPSSLSILEQTSNTISFQWIAPEPAPDEYYWEIYSGNSPVGTPINTGTTPSTDTEQIILPEPGTYYFQVRSVCGELNSNFVGMEVGSSAPSENCGLYQLDNTNTEDPAYRTVNYIDCNGDSQNVQVLNQSTRLICALQLGAGDPVMINAELGVNITYLGEC